MILSALYFYFVIAVLAGSIAFIRNPARPLCALAVGLLWGPLFVITGRYAVGAAFRALENLTLRPLFLLLRT